jgi:polyisoprenoid-binding protein YceI
MSTTTGPASGVPDHGSGSWRLDPARSTVEFRVRHFYGLMTVKGTFSRYAGTVRLDPPLAAELTIEADSLDTKLAKRDKHLRSADFFDSANHPQVRFVSDSVTSAAETLTLRGELHAAGHHVPIEVEATLRRLGDELELDATTQVDQRALGMTWSPLGITRAPSTLLVRGRLVRADDEP